MKDFIFTLSAFLLGCIWENYLNNRELNKFNSKNYQIEAEWKDSSYFINIYDKNGIVVSHETDRIGLNWLINDLKENYND